MTEEQLTALTIAIGVLKREGILQNAQVLKDLRTELSARRTVSGQEAVAWLVTSKRGMVRCAWTEKPSKEQLLVSEFDGDTITPLYAAPIPATELSDDQIRRIWLIETGTTEQDSPLAILDFARAILAANKEKK